jgi:hypothetical protein
MPAFNEAHTANDNTNNKSRLRIHPYEGCLDNEKTAMDKSCYMAPTITIIRKLKIFYVGLYFTLRSSKSLNHINQMRRMVGKLKKTGLFSLSWNRRYICSILHPRPH